MYTLRQVLRAIDFPQDIEPMGPVIAPDVIACAPTAQDVIRLAHLRAQEIVQQAHDRAKEICRSEQERAFEQASANIGQVIDQLLQTKEMFDEQIADFAHQVASKALSRLQVILSPTQKLKACIDQLVGEITPAVSMSLHVSPDSHASTEAYLEELASKGAAALQAVKVTKDPSLAPGDAALVTPTGARLDARLDNMLSRLIAVLDVQASTD